MKKEKVTEEVKEDNKEVKPKKTVKKTEPKPKKIEKDNKVEKKETKTEIKKEEKKEPEIREVIVEKKVGFNFIEVILIMIITLIIGGFLGSILSHVVRKETKVIVEKDKSIEKFDEFIETYEDIKANYYEELDDNQLIEAGIKGMLDFLGDKYSFYMDKQTTDDFNESVEGKYTGIGVEITKKDNGVVVTKVFEDSPAEKAGIKVDDIVYKVFGEDVSQKNSSDIATAIKGSNEKNVNIVVLRNNEEIELNVSRKQIEIQSVNSKVFEKDNKKIGYISLDVFASNSYNQFAKELVSLEEKNIDSLIIDVRSNTGGYLNVVTSIASLFLEKGKTIYQLDTKGVVEVIKDTTKEKKDYKVVVLIDSVSASASEILASSLQESYGATVIGTNSYGKGTVQKAYQLDSGATVKYTIQKWLTANGNWINEVGVTPNIEVQLSKEYFENPTDENDNQLQTAITELAK